MTIKEQKIKEHLLVLHQIHFQEIKTRNANLKNIGGREDNVFKNARSRIRFKPGTKKAYRF